MQKDPMKAIRLLQHFVDVEYTYQNGVCYRTLMLTYSRRVSLLSKTVFKHREIVAVCKWKATVSKICRSGLFRVLGDLLLLIG